MLTAILNSIAWSIIGTVILSSVFYLVNVTTGIPIGPALFIII